MRIRFFLVVGVLTGVLVAATAAQSVPFERLPLPLLDVTPPSARVDGAPGQMKIRPRACRTTTAGMNVRARIVDLAVQEWGFFGFPLVDYADDEEEVMPTPGPGGRGRRRLPPAEAARVAASIGGYWSVTPGGAWILERQNEMWQDPEEESTRWRFPWSAAFISWVMCEAGLGTAEQFQRAIAHHTYIDQAIRAQDAAASRAAYVAHEVGQVSVAPGDMLCTSRRPIFRTLADRRRQLGQGARTHCDLVVKVDEAGGRILAIGGNVRGVVGLKVMPATRVSGIVRPMIPAYLAADRPMFAHLRLRNAPPAPDAFDRSPTVTTIACRPSMPLAPRLPASVSVRCMN